MRSEWKRYQVGDLIAEGKLFVGDGYRAKNEELTAVGLPFARAGNIDGGFHFQDADRFPEENLVRVGNKVSQPGDVVFTSKGTVGRFAFVRDATPRFVYSPQLCFWRALDASTIDPRFLYFWMFGREFFLQYSAVAGQTDMAEYVSLSDQRRMHITLPSLPQQRAIAHVLGTLDDRIELYRRMNETLEATARALFKSWFVDFDPVRAKAEGRHPAGMNAETAALFPSAFTGSSAGKIPKGWRSTTIADVTEINGSTLNASDALDRIEYIEISGVNRGDIHEITAYQRGSAPSRARRRLRHGDTVLSTVRPERRAYFLALWPSNQLIASTGFAVVTPTRTPWSFIHVALTQPQIFDDLGHLADGGAYPAIRPDVIAAIDVTVPDKSEIVDAFHAATAPLFEKAYRNRQESRTLAVARDALLRKLLAGEVRVKDVEKIVEART